MLAQPAMCLEYAKRLAKSLPHPFPIPTSLPRSSFASSGEALAYRWAGDIHPHDVCPTPLLRHVRY
eukprot:695300-Rhodomonas_salina.2